MRGQLAPPVPTLARWSQDTQCGSQCQDIRDKEVSYQGSRRAHLSRWSQEAWFTLG